MKPKPLHALPYGHLELVWAQAELILCLLQSSSARASLNMCRMGEAPKVTRATSQFERSWLKEKAPLNIAYISWTRETSQREMSTLKLRALSNM